MNAESPRSTQLEAARQGTRHQLVSSDLLEHAARLFADRGFVGTTLKDIADAMGISRPAIYHYVSNKEELLAALVRDVIRHTVDILTDAVGRTDLDPGERLELSIREMVLHNARNATRFRMLDRSEAYLPPALAAEHGEARRRVLELLTSAVREASASGHIRPLPDRTVALGLLGLVNWVAWWYRPTTDGNPELIADILVDMALNGIRRSGGHTVERGPWAALALVKEDLHHLEQTLAASLPPAGEPRDLLPPHQ